MGFPENVLAKGEKVERDLHPHWLTVVVPTIFGLLLAAACIFIVIQTPDDETGNRIQWIAVAVLVLVADPGGLRALPAVAHDALRHHHAPGHGAARHPHQAGQGHHALEDHRRELPADGARPVHPGGSLHIESAGDSPDENLTNIPNSNVVQQLINRLIDEDDLRRRARGRGYASPDAGSARGRPGRRPWPRRRRHDRGAPGRSVDATGAGGGAPPSASGAARPQRRRRRSALTGRVSEGAPAWR